MTRGKLKIPKDMIEDAILTKSDTPAPEVGSSFLFGWLGEEIARNRRNAEQATAIADRLALLMAKACADGKWNDVRKVNLVIDQPYVIRRPGTASLELATWRNGWRTIMGGISNGGELEVWEPNEALQRPDEVGSVARSGSPAKRESGPQQSAEAPRSPAKREIDEMRDAEGETKP